MAAKPDNWAKSIIEEAKAAPFLEPRSQEVSYLNENYCEGRVQVFRKDKCGNYFSATRTEITLPEGKVVIHQNFGGLGGIFASRTYFNLLEVHMASAMPPPSRFPFLRKRKQPIRSFALNIVPDRRTTPFNPMYNFLEPDPATERWTDKGYGRGQRLDLTIAERLLEVKLTDLSEHTVSPEVIAWIKTRLSNQS